MPKGSAPPPAQTAIADYGRRRPGVIPLWFGEGDLPAAPPIAEAGIKAIRDGEAFYCALRGLSDLREAICAYLERVHGAAVGVERVSVTSSGMAAIMTAMQALVHPGDEVVVASPVWPNVMAAAQVAGGTVREVSMTPGESGWRLDLDRLFAAVTPRTKALFVNSPNNPTGWMMEAGEMADVMAFARAMGVWVIADEVYDRIVYDRPAAPSFLNAGRPGDRLIVVNSFSKTWAMTGWRLGWMVAPAGLGETIENLIHYSTSGAPAFIQRAGIAALEQGEPYVAAFRERLRRSRDMVMAAIDRWPGARAARPAGAFYAFLQVEGETDSMALARRLVDEAGVGLAPGDAFGAGGAGGLRLCFASRPERVEEALARIERVLG